MVFIKSENSTSFCYNETCCPPQYASIFVYFCTANGLHFPHGRVCMLQMHNLWDIYHDYVKISVNNSDGVHLEFTVTHNVVDDASVDITIDVIPQDDLNIVVVILTIEQLSSCPSDTVKNRTSEGPMDGMKMWTAMYRALIIFFNHFAVVGSMTHKYNGLLPYTMWVCYDPMWCMVCTLFISVHCRYHVTVTRDGGDFEQTVTFRTRGASMLYVVWPVKLLELLLVVYM